ncbi:MAG: NUDIX hydrolase [Clostridiales Family XIII bacterium]|jgi:ADP-ribose pyrophosphatase|nr:NUDIX hydrolase [Clostridiales Family XIII bacterium]
MTDEGRDAAAAAEEKAAQAMAAASRDVAATVEEKTISSDMIYKGAILNLRRDRVTIKDGGMSWREIVEHSGGVAIAAVTDEGRMVMVRQFRKAAESVMLEVPAGKTEPGEDLAAAAARELREETGYSAQKLEHVSHFYTSIGYSTEVLHLYIATGLTPGETDFDENEAIEIYEYTVDELIAMMGTGEVADAKSMIAIFAVKARGLDAV